MPAVTHWKLHTGTIWQFRGNNIAIIPYHIWEKNVFIRSVFLLSLFHQEALFIKYKHGESLLIGSRTHGVVHMAAKHRCGQGKALFSRCMTFADCRLQTADCRPQTADCRLQTADRRLQTTDCRSPVAGCKLNDTKNLPNKGDVIKNITSCESEKVAWEQGWYFCAKLHWPHSQDAVGYSSSTLSQLTWHITNCVDSLFFFDYCELIMTSINAH